MLRTHSQQCGPTASENPTDPVLRSRQPVRTPMTAYPYLQHAPQHQTYEMSYESPMFLGPPYARSTRQVPERFINPNCMPSSDNYLDASRLVPQALPLRIHRHAPNASGSREDPGQAITSPMSSHDREDVGHLVRIDDLCFNCGTAATPSPVHFEKWPNTLLNHLAPASAQQKTRPRHPNHSIPRGFDNLLHQDSGLSTPATPEREFPQKEFYLHIRQQPTAARACGVGGRDRRPVDPPPIVQILLSDFDSESSNDRDILQDPQFTVGCLLFPLSDTSSGLQDPGIQTSQQSERDVRSDGVARADDANFTPLLSGKTFMSPFYVDVDPDPNSAPTHYSFHDSTPKNCSYSGTETLHNTSKLHQPATFFIFADLSIRFAGMYRLKFRLMNWGSVEDQGESIPILAEAWSDPFRVYSAKEFPGMCDSSILVSGLKELGFAELQTRGEGKGKGRKKQ